MYSFQRNWEDKTRWITKKHAPLFLCTSKRHARQCPLTCPRTLPGNSAEANYPKHWWKVWSKKLCFRSTGPRMEELQIIFYKQPPRCWRRLIAVSRSSCWKEEGEIWDRAQAALAAGCWLCLLPAAALFMRHQIEGLVWEPYSESLLRMMRWQCVSVTILRWREEQELCHEHELFQVTSAVKNASDLLVQFIINNLLYINKNML